MKKELEAKYTQLIAELQHKYGIILSQAKLYEIIQESTNPMDEREKLYHAAGFDANRTYPALFQHLGYRRAIAEQLISEADDEKLKILRDMYNRINHEIKLIIGL